MQMSCCFHSEGGQITVNGSEMCPSPTQGSVYYLLTPGPFNYPLWLSQIPSPTHTHF